MNKKVTTKALPRHFALYDARLLVILREAQKIRRHRDFSQVSPFAYRYVNQELAPYTSEQARILYQGLFESSIALALYDSNLCPEQYMQEIISACAKVKASDVYRFEYGVKGKVKGLKHDVRALLKRIKQLISKPARRYVHLLATSNDTLNSADSARLRDVLESVVLPSLWGLLIPILRLCKEYADTVQVGRTHLQHASPQTFGNTMAEYLVRLGGELLKLEKEKDRLVGKFSGPVGTYGPGSLVLQNPMRFEQCVLGYLGLRAGRYSTQIVMPEAVTDVMHRLTVIMGIFGDLGDSLRRLQSTEVSEVAQAKATQGSSSIMAGKINPISFENVKSLEKAEVGRMITVYLDLISDHQRDLTNSASGRYWMEIVEFIFTATKTLKRILPSLVVDESQMMKNFTLTGDLIISDPLNTLLTYYGHPRPHEYVSSLCDRSRATGEKVFDLLMKDKNVRPYVNQMTTKQQRVLKSPRLYIGYAAKRTKREVAFWQKKLQQRIGA
ncbi:MAG: lyase family protein [Patescibacteria group bacterium]|jgi:adenylosuccinate lyase